MKTGIHLEHELKRTISQRAHVDEYKMCHRSSGTSTRPRSPWLEGCVKTDILIEPKKTGTLNENNFTPCHHKTSRSIETAEFQSVSTTVG